MNIERCHLNQTMEGEVWATLWRQSHRFLSQQSKYIKLWRQEGHVLNICLSFTTFLTLRMTLVTTFKWTREAWVVFLALLSYRISSFTFLYHSRQRGVIKPCWRASAFPKVKFHAISKKKGIVFCIWTFDLCLLKQCSC